MVIQYVSPMLVSMLLALIAIRWPRAGSGLYALVGIVFGWLVLRNVTTWAGLLSWLWLFAPLAVLVAFFWMGRPCPARWAYLRGGHQSAAAGAAWLRHAKR